MIWFQIYHLLHGKQHYGTRSNIKGIDDEFSVYVPQGIESGEKIRIPGKGYKDGKGGRGDLIANIKIMVPKNLTQEEKDIFEQLSKVSTFNPRVQKQVNITKKFY